MHGEEAASHSAWITHHTRLREVVVGLFYLPKCKNANNNNPEGGYKKKAVCSPLTVQVYACWESGR